MQDNVVIDWSDHVSLAWRSIRLYVLQHVFDSGQLSVVDADKTASYPDMTSWHVFVPGTGQMSHLQV